MDYLTLATDTRAVPRPERLDFWRKHVTQNHGHLDFDFRQPDRFTGGTRVQRQDSVQLVDFWSSAIAYTRPRRGYDRDGADTLRIVMPVAGAIDVTGRGSAVRIDCGAAAVVSMRQGFRLEHEDGARALILSFPERWWPAPLREGLVATALDRGVGAVFSAMARTTASEAAGLDGSDLTAVVESAVGLLAQRTVGARDDLVLQARSMICQYGDDAAFGPSELASRLGWSLRSVQYALQRAATTPAALIREVRIERAAVRLTSPAWSDRPVSAIAFASGFGSLTAFNAAFRDRYRQTPVEHRSRT